MECIYKYSSFNLSDSILIDGDEFRHIISLRIKTGESILITNGQGLTCLCELIYLSKNHAEFVALQRFENYNENNFRTAVAIPLLSNRERFEFMIEKSVELGVTDIYPVIMDRSQKAAVKASRVEAKILSAMKQSKRSVLPVFHSLQSFKSLVSTFDKYDDIILLDCDGSHPLDTQINKNVLIISGPEGGLSETEIADLNKLRNLMKWNLGVSRLRAETALITGLAVANTIRNLRKQ